MNVTTGTRARGAAPLADKRGSIRQLQRQPGQRQPGQRQPGQRQPGQRQPGQRQPGQRQPGQAPAAGAQLPGAGRRTGSRNAAAGPPAAGDVTRTAVLDGAPPQTRTDTRAAPARAGQADAPGRAAAEAPSIARTPFIAVLLGLLGGGLVCLLVINTTLAAASFRISDLQKDNVQLAQQQQTLQQQVASEESPATIEQQAYRLGMRPQSILSFVDVKTHRRYTSPPATAGPSSIPGYGR
jgi:hypothetical protein